MNFNKQEYETLWIKLSEPSNMQACVCARACVRAYIRGLLEKYPTFGREKETGLLGALDT
jgi:hypothetical protein